MVFGYVDAKVDMGQILDTARGVTSWNYLHPVTLSGGRKTVTPQIQILSKKPSLLKNYSTIWVKTWQKSSNMVHATSTMCDCEKTTHCLMQCILSMTWQNLREIEACVWKKIGSLYSKEEEEDFLKHGQITTSVKWLRPNVYDKHCKPTHKRWDNLSHPMTDWINLCVLKRNWEK